MNFGDQLVDVAPHRGVEIERLDVVEGSTSPEFIVRDTAVVKSHRYEPPSVGLTTSDLLDGKHELFVLVGDSPIFGMSGKARQEDTRFSDRISEPGRPVIAGPQIFGVPPDR